MRNVFPVGAHFPPLSHPPSPITDFHGRGSALVEYFVDKKSENVDKKLENVGKKLKT